MADAAELVGQVMDQAAISSQEALFAGLQAAIGAMIDLSYRRGSFTDGMALVQRALKIGAPVGSPEWLRFVQAEEAARG